MIHCLSTTPAQTTPPNCNNASPPKIITSYLCWYVSWNSIKILFLQVEGPRKKAKVIKEKDVGKSLSLSNMPLIFHSCCLLNLLYINISYIWWGIQSLEVRLCTVKEEYFRPLRGHKNSNNTLYLVNGGSRKFTEIINNSREWGFKNVWSSIV